MQLNKLNAKILILVTILIPVNQIVINYLFRIHFFTPISVSTDNILQPTLTGNLLSLVIFSFLIFVIGKHNLASIWVTKEKAKIAISAIFIIWLISQFLTISGTYLSGGELVLTKQPNVLVGSLFGQLFGNAAFEEFIYRGIIFLQLYIFLKPKTSNKKALAGSVIISQVIFSLMHIPNRLLINQVDNLAIDLLGLFFVGVVLTIIFIRTKNLVFLIGVHTLINQPFNLIDTSFPMHVCIYILIILVTVLWNKITPSKAALNQITVL